MFSRLILIMEQMQKFVDLIMEHFRSTNFSVWFIISHGQRTFLGGLFECFWSIIEYTLYLVFKQSNRTKFASGNMEVTQYALRPIFNQNTQNKLCLNFFDKICTIHVISGCGLKALRCLKTKFKFFSFSLLGRILRIQNNSRIGLRVENCDGNGTFFQKFNVKQL